MQVLKNILATKNNLRTLENKPKRLSIKSFLVLKQSTEVQAEDTEERQMPLSELEI
jgi:hypothetical protein